MILFILISQNLRFIRNAVDVVKPQKNTLVNIKTIALLSLNYMRLGPTLTELNSPVLEKLDKNVFDTFFIYIYSKRKRAEEQCNGVLPGIN